MQKNHSTKNKQAKNEPKIKADQDVRPIINELQRLAKEFAKTKSGREKLMKQTGLGSDGLDSLIYQAKGSVSTWINVFLCVFNFSTSSALNSLQELKLTQFRKNSTTPEDLRWLELLTTMDKDTKNYWSSIIFFARKLGEKKKNN